MLSRLPLRRKLLIALAVPLVVLAIIAAVTVSSAFSSRSVAAAQQDEVDRTVALFQLGNAVRSERDVVLLGGGTDEDLAIRRANVDTILERLSQPQAGYTPEVQAGLIELASQLDLERATVGSSMDGIRANTETTRESAQAFDELAGSTLGLIDFNEDLVADPETSQQLATLQLAVEFNESLNREALIYFQTSTLSRPEQTSRVLRDAADRGQRSTQLEETLEQLATDEASQRFQTLTSGAEYDQFSELRESIADSAVRNRAIDQLPVEVLSAYGLRPNLEAYQAELLAEVLNDAANLQSDAQNTLWRTIGLAVIGGLLVLGLMFLMYRSIRSPLRRLTNSALRIAEDDLPAVVAVMRSAEPSDDDEAFNITPLKAETDDEVGQLVESFNKLHITAVDLAAEQARSRRTASDMFANLGHRNQRLLTQALDEMDQLESDEQNPDRLKKLFSVDQKITRMRRNAESLLVLAGTRTPRQWAEPAPVADVIRAAMAEVEGFERVRMSASDDILVKGAVVADMTHLLAELIENALRFSPPTSDVEVGAHDNGIETLVYVVDRGVGMSKEELAEANARIEAAATSDETPSKRLGHYVVGRLGSRHGISVELREESITGGTVARVVLGDAVATAKDHERAQAGSEPGDFDVATDTDPDGAVDWFDTPEAEMAKKALTLVENPADFVPAAADTPAFDAPAAHAPVVEPFDAPAAEAPAFDAPAAQAPAAELFDAPAVEAPGTQNRRVPGKAFSDEALPESQPQPRIDRTERPRRMPAATLSEALPPVANTPSGAELTPQHPTAGPVGGRVPGAPSGPVRRVPGANLPTGLQSQSKSVATPAAADPAPPTSDSWNAFASFQQSSPSQTSDDTQGTHNE